MWVCAPALRPPPRIVSMSSLKSGSSPSALSRAAANSSSICRVHTGQKVAQYHKSRLWGGTGLSFTLRCLFSCSFGKLALSSNRVNVKSACPKLSILHRPATACSISLERLASVVLLLLFLVSQGIASSESGLGARQGRPMRGNSMAILLTQMCGLLQYLVSAQPIGASHCKQERNSCQDWRAETVGHSRLTLLRRQPRGTIKARQGSVAASCISSGGQAVSLFWCGGTGRSRTMCLLPHRKVLMLKRIVAASDGTEERLSP